MLRFRLPALLAALSTAGCSIYAPPFAGAVIELTLSGGTPLPAAQHLELWARVAHDDVVRIRRIQDLDVTGALSPEAATTCADADPASVLAATGERIVHCRPAGFMIRPAIRMSDPCLIDDLGNLLVTPAAYPGSVTYNGVEQTPDEQAAQVRGRISQLTSSSDCDGSGDNPGSHCGREAAPLYAVLPYDPTAAPVTCETSGSAPGCIPFGAEPAVRLAACQAYWSASVLAYTPDPAQLTAPAHGAVWGYVTYNTQSPPSNYDGFRIESPYDLEGLQELWMTVEGDQVDPSHRGPVYLQGLPDAGGNGWIHFDLTSPAGSAFAVAGTAAVLPSAADVN
jgi:hypothetical protein